MARPPKGPRGLTPPTGNTRVPGHAALHEQALRLQREGQPAKAAAIYECILAADPRDVEALHLLGVLAARTNQHQAAVALIGQAIALAPRHAAAHNSLGNALKGLGRLDEALASFDRALTLQAGYPEAFYNRGNALRELGRLDEALASYDRAIELNPGYVRAHLNRGIVLLDLQRPSEALTSYEHAIRLAPDLAEAHNNRGNALRSLLRLEEALASYERALVLHPRFVDAFVNRGNVLGDLGRTSDALASYDRALALAPDHPDANWNRGLALLLAGDFASAWPLYEWRWRRKGARRRIEGVFPEWDGTTRSSSLLVLPEQGVGDEVFFAGMVADLCERVDRVTLIADDRLVPLFVRSFAGLDVRVVPRSAEIAPHAHQTYVGSLGRVCRASQPAFAGVRSPYLVACPERSAALRSALGGGRDLLCGLSWSSRNAEFGAMKSLTLQALAPLLELAGTRWVNLQYGDTQAEQDALQAERGLALETVDGLDRRDDLDGLAALIQACDLVVTVSNTTAHLAGALGKPVLVLVPEGPGRRWYWHVGRSDSPWYPSATLYRQSGPTDWDGPIGQIRQALAARVAARTSGQA